MTQCHLLMMMWFTIYKIKKMNKIFYGHIVGKKATEAPKPNGRFIKKENFLKSNTNFLLKNINSPQDEKDKKYHHFVAVPELMGKIKNVKHNGFSIYLTEYVYSQFKVTANKKKYDVYITNDSCPWNITDNVEFLF